MKNFPNPPIRAKTIKTPLLNILIAPCTATRLKNPPSNLIPVKTSCIISHIHEEEEYELETAARIHKKEISIESRTMTWLWVTDQPHSPHSLESIFSSPPSGSEESDNDRIVDPFQGHLYTNCLL